MGLRRHRRPLDRRRDDRGATGRRAGEGEPRRRHASDHARALRRRAKGEWTSPIKVDPFNVPIADKVALLIAANEAALKNGARFVNSGMNFLREEKTFANTEGALTVQTLYRCSPNMLVTAVSADNSDFQTRQSTDVAPRGLGYEHVTDSDFVTNGARWAQEAVQKLSAKPVEVGRYDLVLHPTHLWLTIHESVAHPTELDRALGFEANYAGTSFVSPPEKVLGQLKYGPPLMNIQARSQPGWIARRVQVGRRRRGARDVSHHQERRRRRLSDDARAGAVSRLVVQEAGQADALARQLVLAVVGRRAVPAHAERLAAPRRRRTSSWEDIIAATDRGIAIVGDGSFSIDQQRYNAQFGGQLFYEIKGGKIVGMLKDVAYQMRTPQFWGSMDMIGGQKQLLPRRRQQRRQGSAKSEQRRESRLRAVALPRHQRHQHRTDRVSHSTDTSGPRSLFAPARGARAI